MAAIASSGESALHVQCNDAPYIELDGDDWRRTFHLDDAAEWIQQNQYARVGAYIPSELKPYFTAIVLALKSLCANVEFICTLLDASQGSCCMEPGDGQALLHISAMLYFGQPCSPCRALHLPVKFLPVTFPLPLWLTSDRMNTWMLPSSVSTSMIRFVLITVQSGYGALAERLSRHLIGQLPNDVLVSVGENCTAPTGPHPATTQDCFIAANHRFAQLPRDLDVMMSSAVMLVHVGRDDLLWRWVMLQFPRVNTLLRLDVDTGHLECALDARAALVKRRNALVMKATQAQSAVILLKDFNDVETVPLCRELRRRLRQRGLNVFVCVQQGIGECDLALWPMFDVFIVIGCPVHQLVDSRDHGYYKPLLTPFEMLLALEGGYFTSSRDFLTDNCDLLAYAQQMRECLPRAEEPNEAVGDTTNSSSRELCLLDSSKFALAEQHSGTVSWYGLQPLIGETPVAVVTEGRRGIPIKYDDDS